MKLDYDTYDMYTKQFEASAPFPGSHVDVDRVLRMHPSNIMDYGIGFSYTLNNKKRRKAKCEITVCYFDKSVIVEVNHVKFTSEIAEGLTSQEALDTLFFSEEVQTSIYNALNPPKKKLENDNQD